MHGYFMVARIAKQSPNAGFSWVWIVWKKHSNKNDYKVFKSQVMSECTDHKSVKNSSVTMATYQNDPFLVTKPASLQFPYITYFTSWSLMFSMEIIEKIFENPVKNSNFLIKHSLMLHSVTMETNVNREKIFFLS